MNDKNTPNFLSRLRKSISENFSSEELKDLCSDLGMDYENLGGEGKNARVRELISYLNRRGQLPVLVGFCVSSRPQYPWPQEDGTELLSTQDSKNLAMTFPIKILFLVSDPTDLSRLRFGEEFREIQEKLQLAKLRDRIILHQRMSVRPADVSQALLDVQPQVVHFSGHGASSGALYLENQVGQLQPIASDALAALFEQFATTVKVVILNACYSEAQAKAIASHIDCVIGMKEAISDKAAIAFVIGLYQGLGADRTIEDAYKLGCVQIRLQGIHEHFIPVIIKRRQGQS